MIGLAWEAQQSTKKKWELNCGTPCNNCYIEAWIENTKEKYDTEDGVNLGQIIINSNYGKDMVYGMVRINHNNIHPCMAMLGIRGLVVFCI